MRIIEKFNDNLVSSLSIIRLWQPLILFSFADYVVWLHVMERYIYIYSTSYKFKRAK